jgi:hypothetical protein
LALVRRRQPEHLMDVLRQFSQKGFLPPQILFQGRTRSSLSLQVFNVRGLLIGSLPG